MQNRRVMEICTPNNEIEFCNKTLPNLRLHWGRTNTKTLHKYDLGQGPLRAIEICMRPH